MKIEDILAEIILLEFSDYDTAKMLNTDSQTLRTTAQKPQAQRVRDNAQQLRDDQQSQDPLIRRKVMLQKQLAQVLQQIKQKEAQNTQVPQAGGNVGITGSGVV